MKWHKCSEVMPGQEDDIFYHKELADGHAGFLVCFNHGDDEPFFARCMLRKGVFVIGEYCHAYDESRPEGQQECFDKFQKTYWDEEIVVTHWAHIYYPDDLVDEI